MGRGGQCITLWRTGQEGGRDYALLYGELDRREVGTMYYYMENWTGGR